MSLLNAAVLSVAGGQVLGTFISSLIIDKIGRVLLFVVLKLVVNYRYQFKVVIETKAIEPQLTVRRVFCGAAVL